MATVMEEMSAAGVPPILYVLTAFSRESLIRHGSPEQIDKHVRPTLSGERKICFGVTEPEAGTNSFAMRTRAKRTSSGGYVINGQKAFISAADEADHILLIARTAPPVNVWAVTGGSRCSSSTRRRQGSNSRGWISIGTPRSASLRCSCPTSRFPRLP
jgi:alkylation response protein AidB-like acyl-CoA dehydrogenase